MANEEEAKTDSGGFTIKDLYEAAEKLLDLVADPLAPGPDFWTPEGAEVLRLALVEVIAVVIQMPRFRRRLRDTLILAEGESLRGACLKVERYMKLKGRSREEDLVVFSDLDIAVTRFLVLAT